MSSDNKPCPRQVLAAINLIKQDIDANPFHFKRSADLLDHLSICNRKTVEKAFKEKYGAGIKASQVRERLEVAKKLLLTDMTKKQVAAKCFYRSQSTFGAAFKKEFRMTPKEWLVMQP
jgi:AraC-like DNA-binding protein